MTIIHFNDVLSLILQIPTLGITDHAKLKPLRERLRTHKLYTQDQSFTLIIISSPKKSYVMDVY